MCICLLEEKISMSEQFNSENEFCQNGYIITGKIFKREEVDAAKKGISDVINCKYETKVEPENRFWNPGDNPQSIIKIDKPHLSNHKIYKLITNKKFGKVLAEVTRAKRIQVWHTQAVWKPAGGGVEGNAGWHRDIQYWPFWSSKGVFTAWIALTNVKEESGPVRYIQGSNHWSQIDGLDFFDKEISKQSKIIHNFHENYKVFNATIPKGAIAVHKSKTYHSSTANISMNPRVGMVVHFCSDSAKRKKVSGKNSNYLDVLSNHSVCPVIYE